MRTSSLHSRAKMSGNRWRRRGSIYVFVLGAAMGIASGIVVDRHVARVTQRTALSAENTPEKIEDDLMVLLPRQDWIAFGTHYTLHGRYICTARKPHCSACPILDHCRQTGVTDAQ